MTRKLYDEDAYIKEFEATVIESYPKGDGYLTILDQTAFFPEGGGQAADTGKLNDVDVYDVQIENGIIYHYTSRQFLKGETVKGRLNFSRRFDFMQQHSGEHIVSGLAHTMFGCENVGFHLGAEITTVDFDKMLTKEQILTLQREANKKIYANVAIRTYYPDKEALKGLEYRSKKELSGDIRIVEIEDTDICACCAPHVKTAGEIGFISLSMSEKVRGGIRLELRCGMRALTEFEDIKENISAISSALCVKQNETADGVERLLTQISDLKFRLTGLKRQLMELKLSDYTPEKAVTALIEEDIDMKEMQYYADALYKKAGGVRCVFTPRDEGFSFVICGEPQIADDFFKGFKQTFNARGGGRNGMFQGTVFAKREDLLEYVEKQKL